MGSYEPTNNFTTRLKVETTYAEGDVRDHRGDNHDFVRSEYRRNLQTKNKTDEEPAPKGFPPMQSVTKAPQPKTKKDLEVEKANQKDLNQRNIKNK